MIQYIFDFLGINTATGMEYDLVLIGCIAIFVLFSQSIIRYLTLPIELLIARYNNKK